MDSVKLFFINVFLYILFLETYILLSLLQTRFSVELPMLTVFVGGVFTFIALSVWFNVAQVWYTKINSTREMLIRALWSEMPFAILLLILGVLMTVSPISLARQSDGYELFILFCGYLFIFPAVMVMTKAHTEKLADL